MFFCKSDIHSCVIMQVRHTLLCSSASQTYIPVFFCKSDIHSSVLMQENLCTSDIHSPVLTLRGNLRSVVLNRKLPCVFWGEIINSTVFWATFGSVSDTFQFETNILFSYRNGVLAAICTTMFPWENKVSQLKLCNIIGYNCSPDFAILQLMKQRLTSIAIWM